MGMAAILVCWLEPCEQTFFPKLQKAKSKYGHNMHRGLEA